MGFAPGDLKASWVTVFILFLIWWLAMLPRFYYSFLKPTDIEAEDAGQLAKISRAHKAYNRARDGVLLLLTSIVIAFAGAADVAATNALAYIFMSFWIVIVIMSYFYDSKKLFTVLEFTATLFLVALIITAWATAADNTERTSWFRNFLTRKRRPLTRDDVWAIISWAFVGHGAMILVGTTTFASVVLLLANSLQIQEYVACQIGKYLTKSTGVKVSFGSAEPNWREGSIRFKDVRVYCGPPDDPAKSSNYTNYDLAIDNFDVTISMARLLEGKGLAKTCSVAGVRGTIDRSNVKAIPGWRFKPQSGDYDLEGLSIKDLLVTVIQEGFRPFSVSVLSAELPRFRKRWLMFDMMSARSAVGMYDRCLFSVHTPQIELDGASPTSYSKLRHLKIDGLNVDHFGAGSASGPLGWLQRGTVDIDAFVQLPANYREPSEDGLGAALENIRENILMGILQGSDRSLKVSLPQRSSAESRGVLQDKLSEMRETYLEPAAERLRWARDVMNVDEGALESAAETTAFFLAAQPDRLAFKFDLRFRNIRAHVPLVSDEMSTINAALIRPIVAYINEHRPYIPLSCRFELDLGRFDCAWSVHDSGISESLSEAVGEAMSCLVTDKNKRVQRLRKVGLWSLYSAVKNMGYLAHAVKLFKKLRPKPPEETLDDEFIRLECLFKQKQAALEGLVKVLRGYPAKVKNSMLSQLSAVERIRDRLQDKKHVGAPSPGLPVVQRVIVSLLEVEAAIEPEIDGWLQSSRILLPLNELQDKFRAADTRIRQRNARCQDYDRARAKASPSTGKAKDTYEELNQQAKQVLPELFKSAAGVVEQIWKRLEAFHESTVEKWESVFEGLEDVEDEKQLLEGTLREISVVKVALPSLEISLLASMPDFPAGDDQLPSPCSPTTMVIEETIPSPKVQFKVNRPSTAIANSDSEEELHPNLSISALTKSFEKLHSDNSPSPAAAKPPGLPSGQSRVAALTAQLEASKIIFRPMMPTMRKPVRHQEDEEDESYERHLGKRNPFAPSPIPGRTKKQNAKAEVPPKPPRKTYVLAQFDFAGKEKGDLQFRRGDRIEVLFSTPSREDWWTGRITGRVGVFPANYTCPI